MCKFNSEAEIDESATERLTDWGADAPMNSANVVWIDLYDSERSSACLSGVEDKSV